MSSPSVHILILNYCSLDDTLACVDSVKKSTYSSIRLLVIDNNSPDGSGAVLAEAIPNSEFLQLHENIGYAGGNNVGMARALQDGADYVFVVNPDVRLAPEAISAYVDYMESNPSVSAINPIQLDSEGKIDDIFRREMFESNGYEVPSAPINAALSWDVKRLFGAALLLRRSTLEAVGGFDPLYFAYWEEIDLCRRIKYHNGILKVIGASPVIHLRSYTHRALDRRRQFLRLKGMYLFQLKDPHLSLRISSERAFRDLTRNVIICDPGQFGWTRSQYLKTLVWCLLHLPEIRAHRKQDRAGRSYV